MDGMRSHLEFWRVLHVRYNFKFYCTEDKKHEELMNECSRERESELFNVSLSKLIMI